MNETWLDEIVRYTPSELDEYLRGPGRPVTRRREQWALRLAAQIMSVPYRQAVVSVHRTIDGAKMSRRRLLRREPWRGLTDVHIQQIRLRNGYAVVTAEYQPSYEELFAQNPQPEGRTHV